LELIIKILWFGLFFSPWKILPLYRPKSYFSCWNLAKKIYFLVAKFLYWVLLDVCHKNCEGMLKLILLSYPFLWMITTTLQLHHKIWRTLKSGTSTNGKMVVWLVSGTSSIHYTIHHPSPPSLTNSKFEPYLLYLDTYPQPTFLSLKVL